jgi:hypothetical protein
MGAVSLLRVGALRDRLARHLVDPVLDWRNARRPGPQILYLHIGAHKTGTSAIQSTLRAEARRLRWHGIFYDRAFYRLGKLLGARSPLPDGERAALRRNVDERLRARPERIVIGSSEGLFGDVFRGYANIRAVAEDLRAILAGYDVRIIACVRRQDDFVQSVYHQYVKRGGTLRFAEFLQAHDVHGYRWDERLGEYAAVFGRSAISVSCYEDLFRPPAAPLERLFRALPASTFRGRELTGVRNPSLSPKGIEIAIRCNDLLDDEEQWVFRRFLQSRFNQRPGDRHTLFTDEQREALLAFYAASNRRCVETFLAETAGGGASLVDSRDPAHATGRAAHGPAAAGSIAARATRID